MRSTFSKLECDKNGNSVLNISTTTFTGSMADNNMTFEDETKDELCVVRAGIHKYGAENTFFFNYDWRLDPLEHAEALNTFIKSVKSETGCDRVALAAFSMGGTVTCSYLYKYGSSDVDTIILCSTAFQGTSSLGSLFSADIGLSMTGLVKRLAQLTRDNTFEDIINYLNKLLTLSGINNAVSDFANGLQYDLKDRMYSEFITPVFGYMPGLWALVDNASYEKSKEFLLDKDENAELIKRIDEYHYNVQDKAKEILSAAQKDTNIYITAQYNMQGLPVSKTSTQSNNDYLIDAQYASGGATCSMLDDTLGSGYTQKVNCGHNHLSADGQIDASTCMFPEQTWFIRDMGHVDYPYGDSTDFILWLADSEELLNVFSSSEYPQFMKYSYKSNTLVPVKSDNATIADKIFDVLTKITQFTFSIISAIFK